MATTKETKGGPDRGIEPESKVYYTPDDVADFDYQRDLGNPGEYPMTRGPYPEMYRKQPWGVRTYAGFGTGSDSNQRYKYLLELGQSAFNVAFDLPTQNGLDSDDPAADGNVGRVGVAIDTLKDMADLFDGIPMEKARPHFTIQPTGAVILAMWVALGDQRGLDRQELRGTVNNDVLSDYVMRGTWVLPPRPAVKAVGDCIEWCINNAPHFNAIDLRGGMTASFGFACATAYIEEVVNRGYSIDDFGHLFTFMSGAGLRNFFSGIAGMRARRRFWARLMKEKYGATNPRVMMYRTGASSGGGDLTYEQPLNNITRLAYICLANVLGGTQSMNLASYDEGYAIPSEESVRVSQMINQILIHETNICDVVDPLAGSYYIEHLTNQHEQNLKESLEELEKYGGVIKAIEDGVIQRQNMRDSWERSRQVRPTVGRNLFVIDPEKDETRKRLERVEGAHHEYSAGTQQEQINKLQQVKAERDSQAVSETLKTLEQAAVKGENTLPYIIDAVKSYATVGEIMAVLKAVWGSYVEASL